MNSFLVILIATTVAHAYVDISNVTGQTPCQESRLKPELIDIGTFDGLDNATIARMRRSPQPIRLRIVYDKSFDSLPDNDYIKNEIIKPVQKLVSDFVKVIHPVRGPLTFPSICHSSYTGKFTYKGKTVENPCANRCGTIRNKKCGEFYVPKEMNTNKCYFIKKEDYLKKEVSIGGDNNPGSPNTDLVVIIGTNPNKCEGDFLKSAATCTSDKSTGRPVLGSINICPMMDRSETIRKRSVILHEIIHILGFSGIQYQNFRDENGEIRGEWNVVEQISRPFSFKRNGQVVNSKALVSALKTPRVLKAAREFFGCPNMNYVDLEDYDSGSAAGHFEKRTFGNDLMVSVVGGVGYLSPMVMGVLEDSGWYKTDYKYAQTATYGKNAGCSFVQNGCLTYALKKKNTYPYLFEQRTEDKMYSCNPSYEYAERNQLYVHKETLFEGKDSYYDNPKLGGLAYPNFCPIMAEGTRMDSEDNTWSTYCKDESTNAVMKEMVNPFNEKFGKNSACFDHVAWKLTPKPESATEGGASCHQYRCENRQIKVVFDAVDSNGRAKRAEYSCSREGEIMSINHASMQNGQRVTIQAQLKCPPQAVLCKN